MPSQPNGPHSGPLPEQKVGSLMAGFFKTMFALHEIPLQAQEEAARLLGLPTRQEFDRLQDTVQRLEGKIRRMERQATRNKEG